MDISTTDEISKSERKRRHLALKTLGRDLARLTGRQLAEFPLDEALRDAVEHASQLEKSALQRQLRYLAKLLTTVDIEPIETALRALKGDDAQSTARQHRLEHWRESLIAQGDAALDEVLAHHPHVNRTELRNLVRRAQRERERDSGPRTSRELFRYLRDLDAATSWGDVAGDTSTGPTDDDPEAPSPGPLRPGPPSPGRR
jgi:ribosome-associated protein